MPASPTATHEHIKDVNTRYHDAAADEYDAKWGIDFGEVGQRQVRLKLVKALGGLKGGSFGDALEIGSAPATSRSTWSSSGVIERLTATDISPGMLKRLAATAEALGLEDVTTVETEAEALPFEDESFDLVFGHAVLHHIPDLDKAFAEFRRVLRPGGMIAFAGEPSRYGDTPGGAAEARRAGAGAALAAGDRRPQRAVAEASSPTTTRSRARSTSTPSPPPTCAACSRRRLRAPPRRRRGAALQRLGLGPAHGRVQRRAGIDLLRLAPFAFRSYIALQKVDTRVLEPYLPAELFYNLLVSARKPLPRLGRRAVNLGIAWPPDSHLVARRCRPFAHWGHRPSAPYVFSTTISQSGDDKTSWDFPRTR